MDLVCYFCVNVEFWAGFDKVLVFLGFEGDLGDSVVGFVVWESGDFA